MPSWWTGPPRGGERGDDHCPRHGVGRDLGDGRPAARCRRRRPQPSGPAARGVASLPPSGDGGAVHRRCRPESTRSRTLRSGPASPVRGHPGRGRRVPPTPPMRGPDHDAVTARYRSGGLHGGLLLRSTRRSRDPLQFFSALHLTSLAGLLPPRLGVVVVPPGSPGRRSRVSMHVKRKFFSEQRRTGTGSAGTVARCR